MLLSLVMTKINKKTKQRLKKIGDRITQLRKEKGFSNYEQFAFTHGIGRAQYGRYENGSDMKLTSFMRVLDALDVSWLEFFGEGFEEED